MFNPLLTCVLVLTALSACTDDSDGYGGLFGPDPDPRGAVDPTSEVVLLVDEGPPEMASGMVPMDGQVTKHGMCLGLDARVLVLPAGSSWSEDDDAVVLQDGTLVRVGEKVSGTGSTARIMDLDDSDDSYDSYTDEFRQALSGCETSEVTEVAFMGVERKHSAGP